MAILKTVHDVFSFLGFTNYYRKFIYKYAQKAKKKHSKVDWTDECQAAFNLLKETCTNTHVLAYADYKKPFRLNTDVSEKGLGAVLYQQQDDDTYRVIANISASTGSSVVVLFQALISSTSVVVAGVSSFPVKSSSMK